MYMELYKLLLIFILFWILSKCRYLMQTLMISTKIVTVLCVLWKHEWYLSFDIFILL